jgi:small conductance mechanosensitive channel
MDYLNKIWDFIGHFAPKILLAIVIFLLGYGLIQLIVKKLKTVLGRSKHVDSTIIPFVVTLTKIVLLVLLLMVCLDSLSISVTPLITALGAVGVAVSLALKDSLANLLGGSILLATKPFKIGDFCSIDGEEGFISEIGFVYTALNTIDNKKIFIPNGQVTNATVINFNSETKRRLDLKFSIDYNADFELAKKTILDIAMKNPLALKDPEPMVRMTGHQDSWIELTCRVWVESQNYWELNCDMWEGVKVEFDRLGINIPYPQLDVHIK